jgi:hypothetical protein
MMARYWPKKEKAATPPSPDARQTDLEGYIAQKGSSTTIVVENRTAEPIVVTGSIDESGRIQASVHARKELDVDALAVRLRERSGVGFGFSISPIVKTQEMIRPVHIHWIRFYKEGIAPGGRTLIERRTRAWTIREALLYALEYEDRADQDGETRTEEWHKKGMLERERVERDAIETARLGPGEKKESK